MSNKSGILSAAVALCCAAAIGATQPSLANQHAKLKNTSDVFSLPSPEMMPVVSLGYRSAAADLLWAYMLVTQGLRMAEKRRFEYADRYFDSIFALEPTFREPYLLLDTILTFGTVKVPIEDVRATRRLFEQGLKLRPTDAQLHLVAGSFLAYLSVAYLPEEEHREWRIAGAKVLQRAIELSPKDTSVQWHALAGASVLSKNGERAAAISFLERAYASTDDQELKETIMRQLRRQQATAAADRAQMHSDRFEKTWRDELPFVSRAKILLLGPSVNTAKCVGTEAAHTEYCARDWKSWTDRRE